MDIIPAMFAADCATNDACRPHRVPQQVHPIVESAISLESNLSDLWSIAEPEQAQ